MAHLPSYHITACLIEIWQEPDKTKLHQTPINPMVITEVSDIEIEDDYQKLIGTAAVRFPRGTVIRKTLDSVMAESREHQVTAALAHNGVLSETRSNSSLATIEDFKVGSRIRIYLGYLLPSQLEVLKWIDVTSNGPTVWNDRDTRENYRKHLTKMFDGYVVKCSLDTPIELYCENLAYGLKLKTCPTHKAGRNLTTDDLFGENGSFKLLEGTGLTLHPDTIKAPVNVGAINLTTDLTVADVLTEWSKYRLYAFIEDDDNGRPCVKVGQTYFSKTGKDNNTTQRKSIAREYGASRIIDAPDILFDYHVADNNLTLMAADKKFLCVEATALGNDKKFYHVTLRENPEWKNGDSDNNRWQFLNETQLTKKAMKLGARPLAKGKDKVDLSKYTVIPYFSRKIGISKDDLMAEAIKHYENWNMNGIDGTITIFGDFPIISGNRVHLTDRFHSGKNGYYLVGKVHTVFGVNGYRQTLSLPYCIMLDSKEENDG